MLQDLSFSTACSQEEPVHSITVNFPPGQIPSDGRPHTANSSSRKSSQDNRLERPRSSTAYFRGGDDPPKKKMSFPPGQRPANGRPLTASSLSSRKSSADSQVDRPKTSMANFEFREEVENSLSVEDIESRPESGGSRKSVILDYPIEEENLAENNVSDVDPSPPNTPNYAFEIDEEIDDQGNTSCTPIVY